MAFGDTPPAGAAPEGTPAPEPATNPFESWGQVFTDPASVNPYELHQHAQWVQDLRGDGTHEPTLERAMRDWGYLQEGESLADLQAALEGRRSASADPFAAAMAAAGAEPDPGEEFQMDPHTMRQIWQQDMASQREQMMADFETQQRNMQLGLEIQRQLDQVAAKESLSPDDQAHLQRQVQYMLDTGQVQPQGLATLAADTYAAEQARFNTWMNARLEASKGGTEPVVPAPAGGGATPTASAPVTSLRDIARATMERMAQGDD